jgi:ribosomal protein L22
MTEDPKKDEVEETTAGETPEEQSSSEETVAETTTDVDQLERADEEAARASAAAEEAEEAAEDAGTPTAVAAAEEAEELAEKAEEAAEAAADQPKPKRARKAREAEQAADQAEEAAEEATESAKRSRARRKKTDDEEQAKPARKRDERRPVPVGVEVRAQAKYVRTSARKARLVCDHIRGKDVVEARAILAFTPRRAAEAWIKLLESAVANAEHNHELVGEELRILSVHADEGPTLKRFRPRAMGRATRIRKRTSHLSITLTPKES